MIGGIRAGQSSHAGNRPHQAPYCAGPWEVEPLAYRIGALPPFRMGFLPKPDHGCLNPAPMSAPRVIFHLDMDAFYASVEQRDTPEWR